MKFKQKLDQLLFQNHVKLTLSLPELMFDLLQDFCMMSCK